MKQRAVRFAVFALFVVACLVSPASVSSNSCGVRCDWEIPYLGEFTEYCAEHGRYKTCWFDQTGLCHTDGFILCA